MNAEEATAYYIAMAPSRQPVFLLAVAHALTVVARDAYPGQSAECGEAASLIRINEAIHRAISHVMRLMNSDRERYPDEVLFRIMYEYAPGEMRKAIHLAARQIGGSEIRGTL